jgi:hypothetical protein
LNADRGKSVIRPASRPTAETAHFFALIFDHPSRSARNITCEVAKNEPIPVSREVRMRVPRIRAGEQGQERCRGLRFTSNDPARYRCPSYR